MAAHLHHRLAYVYAATFDDPRSGSRPRFKEKFNEAFNSDITIGALWACIRDRQPEGLREIVGPAVLLRNYLAHLFVWETRGLHATEEGLTALAVRLDIARDYLQIAGEALHKRYEDISIQAGVDPVLLAQHTKPWDELGEPSPFQLSLPAPEEHIRKAWHVTNEVPGPTIYLENEAGVLWQLNENGLTECEHSAPGSDWIECLEIQRHLPADVISRPRKKANPREWRSEFNYDMRFSTGVALTLDKPAGSNTVTWRIRTLAPTEEAWSTLAMPKAATGHFLKHANGYSARVRIGGGRPSFPLAVRSDGAAELRAKLLGDVAKRLAGVASVYEIGELLKAIAGARTDKGLAQALEAVDAIATGVAKTTKSALTPTFEAFAKDWTSGELHRKHPDHVREKDSTRDAQVLRDFINPAIGPKPMADVTLEDAERVMAGLPPELAPRSRKLVAQCMRKVLSLAVYPGRYLTANPIPQEWMPKIPKSANKAKSCLYPEEEAKLVSCPAVVLERRLAYGILAREGMRASELASLRWRDVDLQHGRVRLDENKTDDPRAWALSPDVVRALAWWQKRTGAGEGDLVLGIELKEAAKWLRGKGDDPGDLRRAGITRPELFERSAARQPLRAHDLRATFVTISLANGKTEQWVTDRTGHRSSQMLATYTRQARTWTELGLGELSPLDALLPEVAAGDDWTSNGQQSAPPGRLELPTFGLGNRCSIL